MGEPKHWGAKSLLVYPWDLGGPGSSISVPHGFIVFPAIFRPLSYMDLGVQRVKLMCTVFCGLLYILRCPQIRAITGDYSMKFGNLEGKA